MNDLIITRGLPGAGKSHAILTLMRERNLQHRDTVVCSADHFFMKDDEYVFNVTKLGQAHMECQKKAFEAMSTGMPTVIIDNTNSRLWEYEFYVTMAACFDYQVEILMVGGLSYNHVREYAARNIHGVPEDTVLRMAYRWED